MKNILVPVDGSESAGRAARFAAELARSAGAHLRLLHVYDAPSVASMGLVALSDGDLEKARDDVAVRSFEAAARALGDLEAGAERHVALGNPTVEILAFADEHDVDLIVIGSRGLSPIQGLVLGSVSERVLKGATCPVAVVR